jgi:hypothetical protein
MMTSSREPQRSLPGVFTVDPRRFEFPDQEKPLSQSEIESGPNKPNRKKKRNAARSEKLRKSRCLGGKMERIRI